jgi:hypothetical protein
MRLPSASSPRTHRWVLNGVFVWLVLFVLTMWWVGSERLTVDPADNQNCRAKSGDGTTLLVGPSTWQWVPPGKVCHWSDGTVSRPGLGRILVLTVAVATIPLALVALRWRAKRLPKRHAPRQSPTADLASRRAPPTPARRRSSA